MSNFHYINGRIVSDAETFISPFDLGYLRGYGVFDYISVYEKQIFHLADHLVRLKHSAECMNLSLPISIDEMDHLAHMLVEKNPSVNGGLRYIISGGETQDLLTPSGESNLTILFHPISPNPDWFYSKGYKVISTYNNRLLPSVKTTNYFPAIFAMQEAKKEGFNDALYINEKNEILEGTTCNVFFFKKDTLITSDSGNIVKGVTRKILLDLAFQNHYSIECRPISINEIEDFSEAFLCSSVKDVIPLVQIDNKIIGEGIPGKQTMHLRNIYRSYKKNYLSNLTVLSH